MQERHLLIASVFTACIGIIVLWMIPERPDTATIGIVDWHNGSSARLLIQEEVWVDFDSPTELAEGLCVIVDGHRSTDRVSNARLSRVRRSDHHRCR